MIGTRTSFLLGLLSVAATVPLAARSAGAPDGFSGAPGEGNCTACHAGTANSGSGKVAITFAEGSTYTPGQMQRVTITITDSNGRRWGFQATPRVSSDASKTGAGVLSTSDDNARLGGTSGTLQWITHTSAGTRNGTAGPVTFSFNWTPPATAAGDVTFYVAANAANGNGNNQGDSIYTAQAILTPGAASSAKPAVKDSGVVSAANSNAGVVSGSWISIYGENLAPSSRGWKDSEFVNNRLPTSLDGVTVDVNGKTAAISYISPGQINAQVPDDTAVGNVMLVVKTPAGESTPKAVSLQRFSPAFFPFAPMSGRYAAAIAGDGAYLAPAGLFGTAAVSRPAKPGETIQVFATGFGPTNPAVAAGVIFSGAAKLANDVTVTVGGMPATVAFAGLSGAGLYQVNITVPTAAPDGDLPIVATVGGVSTPANVFLPVQK